MQAVKNNGVPSGTIPVVLMRNLAVRNNCTKTMYVQGGKLEGGEISEKVLKKKRNQCKQCKRMGRQEVPSQLC